MAMTPRRRGHRHRNLITICADALWYSSHRYFATKYTAKITSSSPTGHSLSAEVAPPPPLPTDVRGYALPRRDLICKATRILLSPRSDSAVSDFSDRFSDLSRHFHSLSVSLTPSEASEIIKSIKCTDLALQFFQLCPSMFPKFRHDAFTYNRILLVLSKSYSPSRFDQVRSIMKQMEQDHVTGTISTVNILIGLFGNTEDLELCIGLVKKWELKLNSYTYKCLLQAYLRSHDSNKAFQVYAEMRGKGLKLDIFAYNMLLDALAKDEKYFIRLTRLARFMKT